MWTVAQASSFRVVHRLLTFLFFLSFTVRSTDALVFNLLTFFVVYSVFGFNFLKQTHVFVSARVHTHTQNDNTKLAV